MSNLTPTNPSADDGARPYALVLDDHPLTGRGVVALLSSHPMLAGAVYAADVAAAQELVHSRGVPGLVVADFWLGTGTSSDWVRTLLQANPDTRVIVVSADERASVKALMAASGAHGYIAKTDPPADLIQAVTALLSGDEGPTPDRPDRPDRADRPDLTPRQAEVLNLVLRGWPNKRIANELALTEATVKEHVSAILARLSVANRAQLIASISSPAGALPDRP